MSDAVEQKDDSVMPAVDYSTIELRILAQLRDDPARMRASSAAHAVALCDYLIEQGWLKDSCSKDSPEQARLRAYEWAKIAEEVR